MYGSCICIFAYAYVCMYVCTCVCMYVWMYACMCLLCCLHSSQILHNLCLHIDTLFVTHSNTHINVCYYSLVLSIWHLRFHVHLQVVLLVHLICAFTLCSASSNPVVLDCIRYKAFLTCHVCNIYRYTYILHACYSFVFHIQSLSAFALRFIHPHAYLTNMYAANYSNCTVLFGLYIKHGLIYQSRVMAVILNEIVDILAHNFLSLSCCWCNKHCVAVDECDFLHEFQHDAATASPSFPAQLAKTPLIFPTRRHP